MGVAVVTACVVDIRPGKETADTATPVTVSAAGTAVTIGEIYENCNNVQNLYDLLGGAKGTSFAKITAMATATTSAADIRAKTYNKTANQDVQVTFGGLVWDVVYLSTTSDNRPILTLWLDQPFTNSQWNKYLANANNIYPSDLYGTSYIRAWLNNGGKYATSGTALNGTYTPNTNYVLKEFLPDGKYSALVVTPSYVSWQESSVITDFIPNCTNVFYGADAVYTNDNLNYAKYRTDGDAWKNDNLWLPSINYEACHEDSLWSLSVNQNIKNVVYWGRDGDHSLIDGVWRAQYIRTNEPDVGWTYADKLANTNTWVRPALHLDLSALDNHRAGGEAHLYSDWELTTEPTCADGEYTRVCQNCGYVDRKASPAVISHHSYGDWEIVSIGSDTLLQRRTCAVCGSTKERTTPPYQHQITIKSNYADRLVLTTTLYTEQTTAFTAQDWLNYLNRLTDFDDIVCRGTVRYFDLPSEQWCTADVLRIEQYDNNMFTYYYPRSDGVMVAVRTTITHLTLTATVQDLRKTS